jgi:glycine reductase
MAVRVVHYLNQFFAGVGGEASAGMPPGRRPGPIGPGALLQAALGDRGNVVSTVYCGDNYANETPGALDEILPLVASDAPDILIAGPAFAAGRYGLACGAVSAGAQEALGITTVTGMHAGNPGVDLYRTKVYIASTRDSALGMRDALEHMARLALRLHAGEELGPPLEEGYLPTGRRVHQVSDRTAAQRAVDMLLRKVNGQPYATEWEVPTYSLVDPASPLSDVHNATIAMITTGGVVPRGNPDRLESAYASKWLRYPIDGLNDLTPAQWQSVHGGYDTTNVNDDPDRMAPLDALRELEREGAFQHLYPELFTTVGNTSAIPTMQRFAKEMSRELKAGGVQGVILTGA